MTGGIGDVPARSFGDYARALTLRHGELLLGGFILATVVGACLDPLTTAASPRAMAPQAWRAIMIGVSVAGLVVARQLRTRLAHVHTAVAVYAITSALLLGGWLADSGGADPARFLASCAVPLAVMPLVLPLRVRVALSLAVGVACAGGYVAVQPAALGERLMLGPALTLVVVGAIGVLLGDHYFRLVRAHHGQRVHMQQRIADGTKRSLQLLAEVERAQEAERRRIGRELHDELAQGLTALKLEVSLAHRKVEPGTPTAAALARIDLLSDQLVQAKQRLVQALRPATLDQLGFGPAVELHVVEVAGRSGLAIELVREPADLSLPEPAATTVYRALQESLANVVRHACAIDVRVRIALVGDAYLLEVTDDGIGFDPRAVTGAHFGLVGMRERTALLGGTCDVMSAPGAGTRVIVRLPADVG